MSASIHALERWQAFVESQVWDRGSLDQSSYLTFLRAGSLGIDPQEAIDTVATRIRAAGDHPSQAKLNQQLRRAYWFTKTTARPESCCPLLKAERPTFLPDYARKFAERVPEAVDASWLRRQSPVKVPWLLTPAEFLFSVYEPGDQVRVFTDYRSQGQELWQKYSLRLPDRDELTSFVKGSPDGVWFLANPVDGKEHFNERQQRMSRRSEESIKSFRFAVLESDVQASEQCFGSWYSCLCRSFRLHRAAASHYTPLSG